MRSRVPTAYFLIPVLYLAIIGFFTHLHLTGGETDINEQVGPLQVEAQVSGGVAKSYEFVRISFFGFSLDLSEGIAVEGAGGTRRKMPVTSVETLENSIRISGEGGAALVLSLGHNLGAGVFSYPEAYTGDGDGQGIRVDWIPPEKEAKASVQLSLLSSYDISRVAESVPLFSAVSESSSYLCTATGKPSVDDAGILDLRLSGQNEGAAESGCIFVPFEGEEPLRYWYFGNREPKARESYEELYGSWREAAYSGWTSRYQPNESSWRGGSGGMSEFEAVMTAYAAETMRRDGDTGLGSFTEAMDAFGGRHSFSSSAYLGNIIGNNEDHAEQERSRAARILESMEKQDPSFLSVEQNLLLFLIWHGEDELINEFESFVADLDPFSIEDPEALVNLFSSAVEAAQTYPERFPRLVESLEGVYEAVRRRMVRIGDATVFPTGEAIVESSAALRLGKALMSYGELSESTFAEELGLELTVMVLGQADEEGFVPASFAVSGGSMMPQKTQTAPEKIYPILSSNNFYPRLVSLADELDADIRLWTVAKGVGAARSGNSISITFDFAVGEMHYVVVRGVPPFDNFNLYGYRWNSDRRFQTYGVGGWFYDEERRTLYIKFRHQTKVERVELSGL